MKTEKRRYILVESASELNPESGSFEHDFLKELLHNIGEVNYHGANPRIIKYMGKNRFVLRCNLQRYRDTIIALTFMKRVGGADTGFYTLNASGTILALSKEKNKQP